MQALVDVLILLRDNPILWAIGILISCVSYFVAEYRTYREKRKKAFSYAERGVVAASKLQMPIDGLRLTYRDKNIQSLLITQFSIWNSGRGAIRADTDVARLQPICIRCVGTSEILAARILRVTNIANRFRLCAVDSKQATFDFDFANENDGFLVQIWHTGEFDDLIVDGGIIEGEKIKSAERITMYMSITGKPAVKLTFGFFIFSLVSTAYGLYRICIEPSIQNALALFFLLLFTLFCTYLFRNARRSYMPKPLRCYDEITVINENNEDENSAKERT